MNKTPLVSLCMPTNGVIEWVFPVLESIYNQNINPSMFEVVVTDNGNNKEFKEEIRLYQKKHVNLFYYETQALPFVNEIESYKHANGELIKFVNHRTKLKDGFLGRLIRIVNDLYDEKPILYFSNGALDEKRDVKEYKCFDDFVRGLSYYSSWSTGMTIWKDDLKNIDFSSSSFNELFPHTNILFSVRDREKYIIDNTDVFEEMPQGNKPKGNYDVFYAFGVEYPAIILDLLRDGSISANTFRIIKEDNLEFIAKLYYNYVIRKHYCSYNLNGLNDIYNVFYTKKELIRKTMIAITKLKIKQLINIKKRKR